MVARTAVSEGSTVLRCREASSRREEVLSGRRSDCDVKRGRRARGGAAPGTQLFSGTRLEHRDLAEIELEDRFVVAHHSFPVRTDAPAHRKPEPALQPRRWRGDRRAAKRGRRRRASRDLAVFARSDWPAGQRRPCIRCQPGRAAIPRRTSPVSIEVLAVPGLSTVRREALGFISLSPSRSAASSWPSLVDSCSDQAIGTPELPRCGVRGDGVDPDAARRRLAVGLTGALL